MTPAPASFASRLFATLRTLLLTGIAVWMPLVITLWVLHFLLTSIDGIRAFLPEEWQPAALMGHELPGFGILMVVLVLLISGFFARNFIGIKIIAMWEDLLDRIPVVKSIYRGVKQISDNLFSGQSKAFREAVMVEFPREGAWTIGFVTSQTPPPHLHKDVDAEDQWLGLYVPTTPNPTSGYFIWVLRAQTRKINMNVEEALKLVVSLGMVTQSNAAAKTRLPPPAVDMPQH